MRIAFLSFYSGRIDRGVEVATQALARGLKKHYEVIVFQAGERIMPEVETVQLLVESRWPEDSSESWLRFFYLDYYSRKILKFTGKFLPYFFRYKYDVVIPTNGGWQVVLTRLITWILGKKMVVQGNAGIGRDDLFQLLCFPDSFIAISPNGYKWAKKHTPWVHVLYIPYGVDIDFIENSKPKDVPLKKPIVFCVAAFSPYKRIKLLIHAMEKAPQANLLVIGQGPLEKELRVLGQKMLGKRFLLKSGVSHNELIGYYKASNVFSLPSRSSEAFGIVYIEAMAAGLPIVSPDDWRREIIGDAGVYVDPENPDEYAKGIELALSTNFGDKPRNQAEKFEWKKIIIQYKNLLHQV